MSSCSTDCESAMRNSALALLYDTTVDAKSSPAIERAINHLLSIVQGAIAEFAHDWNEKRSPTTWETLPAETKLHCLSFLAPRQRVKMLLISRSVQAFMLAHPTLWTDIALPYFWEDSHDEYLRMMVARSGTRELRIVWPHHWDTSDELPEPPRTYILNALPRISELTLHPSYFPSTPQRFQAAPVLRRLSITELVKIHPSVWNSNIMPQLRDLRLDRFTLCAAQRPMESVVRFEGTLWARSHWSRIWSWFPRLETLVLYNFLPDFDEPLGPPPASLRRVVLHTNDESSLEPELVSLVVDAWAGHGIRKLYIYCDTNTALRDGVTFLMRAEPGMWSAQFRPAHPRNSPRTCAALLGGGDTEVAIIADDRAHLRQIKLVAASSLLDRLETLSVHSSIISTLLSTDLTLPALRCMTIVNDWDGLSEFEWPDTSVYLFPALREEVLDLTLQKDHPRIDSAVDILSQLVSSCVRSQDGLLDRITVLFPADSSWDTQSIPRALPVLERLTSEIQVLYQCPRASDPNDPLPDFHVDNDSFPGA